MSWLTSPRVRLLQRRIDARDATIAALDTMLARRDGVLAKQDNEIAALRDRIMVLHAAASAVAAGADGLRGDRDKHRDRADQAEAELATVRARLAELEPQPSPYGDQVRVITDVPAWRLWMAGLDLHVSCANHAGRVCVPCQRRIDAARAKEAAEVTE